jgi:hypothetical protein
MGAAAVVFGLSLAIILVIAAAFVLARRKHRLSTATPKDRYQRDIRELQMETHRQTKPGPARQLGNPEGGNYGNFGGIAGV